ncbi:MAG: ankyrin repeat domain-containing protein [Gammaproteobacteria bacterium]|nr:ankyrin repeat domain-containing protein [Gammaproteobacteria bacterium]
MRSAFTAPTTIFFQPTHQNPIVTQLLKASASEQKVRLHLLKKIAYELTHNPHCNLSNDALQNQSPLHVAAFLGHAEIVELLINKGIDVDATDAEGATPLHYAAFGYADNCKDDTVKILIKNSKDLLKKNTAGDTALHIAEKNNNLIMAKALMSVDDQIAYQLFIEKNGQGRTAVYDLALRGSNNDAAKQISTLLMDKEDYFIETFYNQHKHFFKKLLKDTNTTDTALFQQFCRAMERNDDAHQLTTTNLIFLDLIKSMNKVTLTQLLHPNIGFKNKVIDLYFNQALHFPVHAIFQPCTLKL